MDLGPQTPLAPNPSINKAKQMNTPFLNCLHMDLGPQTPIAPNPSTNKAKKMSTHCLSLG